MIEANHHVATEIGDSKTLTEEATTTDRHMRTEVDMGAVTRGGAKGIEIEMTFPIVRDEIREDEMVIARKGTLM